MSQVFFDMSIDNKPAGRIAFKLYTDKVPKTAGKYRKIVGFKRVVFDILRFRLHYFAKIEK